MRSEKFFRLFDPSLLSVSNSCNLPSFVQDLDKPSPSASPVTSFMDGPLWGKNEEALDGGTVTISPRPLQRSARVSATGCVIAAGKLEQR